MERCICGRKLPCCASKVSSDLFTARAEVARLTAEVEARKSGSDIWHRAAIEAQDERDALRAEVEAMRAALRSSKFALIQAKKAIARNLDTGGEDEWAQCDYAIREIDVIDKGEHLDALRARKVGW